jgi:hypothetical protein
MFFFVVEVDEVDNVEAMLAYMLYLNMKYKQQNNIQYISYFKSHISKLICVKAKYQTSSFLGL